MKTKNRRKRKINYKKFFEEMLYLIVAALGVVVFVCNVTRTFPEPTSAFKIAIACIMAYGFLVGPAFTMLGIAAFLEVRG